MLAGSVAAIEEAPSLQKHFPNITQLRQNLVGDGVLIREEKLLRFTQDYTFNSPSLASCVVLGSSSNGRTDWKDKDGRTLKQIQESETQTTGNNTTQ